jgi:hypothetical protein
VSNTYAQKSKKVELWSQCDRSSVPSFNFSNKNTRLEIEQISFVVMERTYSVQDNLVVRLTGHRQDGRSIGLRVVASSFIHPSMSVSTY